MFIIHVFLWLHIVGGCGAMYTVFVEAEEFRGQRTIKQHRMVNEVHYTYKNVCVNSIFLLSHYSFSFKKKYIQRCLIFLWWICNYMYFIICLYTGNKICQAKHIILKFLLSWSLYFNYVIWRFQYHCKLFHY